MQSHLSEIVNTFHVHSTHIYKCICIGFSIRSKLQIHHNVCDQLVAYDERCPHLLEFYNYKYFPFWRGQKETRK